MNVSSFNGLSVLITGGAGFVGSNLTSALLNSQVERVTIIDNLLSSTQKNIPVSDKITFIKGSISDDLVLTKINDEYDYIFHLATFHGNQNSIHDPLMDHQNNTLTTLKLLETIKNFKKLKKIVYASAGCTVAQKTYDSPEETFEDDPISLYLDSPYQISKIIGEFYLNFYNNHYGLPVVKARFQNVYGPGEILGAGEWRGTISTIWRNVTPTFIYKILNNETIELDNEGKNSRDFIYVDDLVEGLLLCALIGVDSEVYNLASGVETTIKTLADNIYHITEKKPNYIFKGKRAWDHSGRRYGSTKKASEQLGFKARTSLNEGLKRTIVWTKDNFDLINSAIKSHKSKF
jgi:UDP-glucose 4-epimerase